MDRVCAAVAGVSLVALAAGVTPPVQARAAEAAVDAPLPTNAEILELLKSRIDQQRMGRGMVVGVIDASGPRIVSYGVMAQDDPRPVNGDTVFEIQSVTKTFTTLLLADMVQRGEVGLDDPVARYLPAGVKVPERNGRQITLADLATHTSGLPSAIPNLKRRTDGQPGFEEYTADDLYAFLRAYTLTRDPGTSFEYTNLGMGLLGAALARRAGIDFAELMRIRILAPLGMTSSAVVPTEAMKMRLAGGHDAYLRRVRWPDTRTLEGSWGLRSTARDMLAYLAAELGYRDTPLKAAMALQLSVRRPASPGVQQALGWEVRTVPGGGEVVSKNGGDRGFGAFVAFDGGRRRGVVVLTNRDHTPNEDIGRHLILGTPVRVMIPPRPPGPHTQIAVDSARLEKYAGSYRMGGSQVVTIRARNGGLTGQAAGTPEIPLYPESPTDFFANGPDVLVSFQVEADQVKGLRLQLNGEVMTAVRIERP